MKCKICGQKSEWIYTLLNGGRCVHCKLYIEGKLNPTQIEVSQEWRDYAEKSEKACDEWLSRQP